MVDSRFYDYNFSQRAPLENILSWIGNNLLKPINSSDLYISGVSTLESSKAHDLVYLDSLEKVPLLKSIKAPRVCIVTPDVETHLSELDIPIVVDSPKRIFALVASKLYTLKTSTDQKMPIHPSAIISKSAKIASSATIGPNVIIKDNVVIEAFSYLGPGVSIGEGTHVESHTSIICADIGNYVRLGAGCRIGQEGFGFIMDQRGHITMPHLGSVEIEDNVRIGANACIDRGVLEKTHIKEGSRIDNLVQIAHNVHIGDGSVMAAQVGIAGSTKVGKYVVMGGQVGVTQHLNIGDKVQIAAQSGVMTNIPGESIYSGSPAVPIMQWRRQNVMLQKLVKKKRI